jgi:ribonuclease R
MKKSDLMQAILELVNKPGYKPIKPRVIAKKLGITKDRGVDVKKAVKKLVSSGQMAYGADHLVQPADAARPKGNRMVGVFQRRDGGFGFVRPSGAVPGDSEVADVYIPARRTRDAATGDEVAVRLIAPGRKHPGPRGEIVEVIERATHRFVGTYFERDGYAMVQVDGTLFRQPIVVGDPEASDANDGDKVVLEMVRFPSLMREGEAVITEILGPRGKPGVDTLSIIREFDLPDEFDEATLEESRSEAHTFDETILDDRLDATAETVITIDPIDARDFDDAISLERLENGHWRLGVHIADVAHFVRPGTALDREARSRATSVYLPDRVIPMLPEVISNSLASLQPGKVRYTKSAYIEFTAEGQRVATDVHRAAIKSNKRLAYEQVDQFLEDPTPWRKKLGKKVFNLLDHMHELAMILRSRRMAAGALEMSMPEIKIELDKQGRVSGAHTVENTVSHQIIEEFMLAANVAVADLLAEKELFFLRRIHQAPTPRKLKALTEFVNELGIKTASLQSRFELQKLLKQVVGQPEERAVNLSLLRSMQRAVYSPIEEGHYALASECYCHFTSPIRRYPDLTVHRLLDAVVTGRKPANNYDELVVSGEHCSNRERRAEAAERQLVKLKLLDYMSRRIGEEMDAVISGVESFGLFAQGVQLPAEGLIRIDALMDDYYQFDRSTHTLAGRRKGNTFRLGDRIRVAVVRVDLDRRELDFRFVRRLEAAQPARKTVQKKRGAAPSPKAKRSTGAKQAKPSKKPAKRKKATARKKAAKGRKPRK